jgi:hypothetical protein
LGETNCNVSINDLSGSLEGVDAFTSEFDLEHLADGTTGVGALDTGGSGDSWSNIDPHAFIMPQDSGPFVVSVDSSMPSAPSSPQRKTTPESTGNWYLDFTKAFFSDFSLLGPEGDPRPSCLGIFAKSSLSQLNPFPSGVPSATDIGAVTYAGYEAYRMSPYAVSRIAMPVSKAARAGLSRNQWWANYWKAGEATAAKTSFWVTVDVALANGVYDELDSALDGNCK